MTDIIIFEDNPAFASYIQEIIKKSSSDFCIPLVTDNFKSLQRYLELLEKPTIFLLDIMFGDISEGFKMADIIRSAADNAIIVFITDYPDRIFLNSVYKLKAFNVILKTSEAFEDELLLTLAEAVKRMNESNIIVYSDKFTTILINIGDIIFIESVKGKNKIMIHHSKGIFVMRSSLFKIISQLSDNFIRCHNSYIVNTRYISEIDHTERTIKMINGGTCYYSSLNKDKLFNSVRQQGGGSD